MLALKGTDKKLRKNKTISSKVRYDEITKQIGKLYDFEFTGETVFELHSIKERVNKEFNIGLIVGSSGSGKSLLLKTFGEEEQPEWKHNLAVSSHFESADEAIKRFTSVGLNSIPSWLRPYHTLSNGERYRVDLSRKVRSNAVIDEFTSVVDRNVAKSCSFAIQKYIRRNEMKNIVFASCHFDVIDWLQPDWIYNTDTRKFKWRLLRQRPEIKLNIFECDAALWEIFKKHHYLTGAINKSGKYFAAFWDEVLIGFAAALPLPSGHFKNAYRSHRTVVLPDFQGFGLGTKLQNAVAQLFINSGKTYYSRVSHPVLGMYRNAHPEIWRPTSANETNCMIHKGFAGKWNPDIERVCFSHQYIAPPDGENLLFQKKDPAKGIFD